jgi:hypothetical protein
MRTTPQFRHTKFKPFQQLKASVLNRPSQQVRRELALGESFSNFSCSSRSIGPPQKPNEISSFFRPSASVENTIRKTSGGNRTARYK